MAHVIIGFSGKIGSGKNYLAETIAFNMLRNLGLNVQIMAFGDYLKIQCRVLDSLSYDSLFHEKTFESRAALQTRGMIERSRDDSIFVNVLDCNINIAIDRGIDCILVTDVRFDIEFNYLSSIDAALVRISAPGRTASKMMAECNGDLDRVAAISDHSSEKCLDSNTDFDYYIDNDVCDSDTVEKRLHEIITHELQGNRKGKYSKFAQCSIPKNDTTGKDS